MTDPSSQPEKPRDERRYDPELLKKGLRCDLDQYEMLKRCSDNKDLTEWNDECRKNAHKKILLEGASLQRLHLKGVRLEGAELQRANLENANLEGARLQNAVLWEANLKKANLRETCLQHTRFMRSMLQGAEFGGAKLQDADFSRAIVDGETLIWRCKIDHETKFEGVVLDAVRIYPATKQLLEYNVRRMNWEAWYKKHPGLTWLVKPFWWMSDYGRSTGRIAGWFFGLALLFATIYYLWGLISPPGIISSLFEGENGPVPCALVPVRSVYFSVVTMTTLGFGDMYADAQSIWGHILLTIQVILGYVLMGALVTRFAVLFTAGGPAGKFADGEKDDDGKY